MNRLMTVDPGISGSAYAVWNNKWQLVEAQNLYPSSEADSWEDACVSLSEKVAQLTIRHEVTVGAIEYPAYFASVSGEMVAKKGDLLKLTFLVGMLYCQFVECTLVPVREWLGQLPKEVVEGRIRRILGAEACKDFKSHTWYAVGIGLYLKGDFK